MEKKLQELGLTSYESKVYLCLLGYGQMDAKKISERSAVPPTAVYPNLKTLVEKKLVQRYEGDVAHFEASDPGPALRSFCERKQKELLGLRAELVDGLEKIQGGKEVIPQKKVLSLSRGRQASFAIYRHAIESAQRSIYIMGWRFIKVSSRYEMLKWFKSLKKDHVDIKLLFNGSPGKNQKLGEAFQEAGIEMRVTNSVDNFTLLIVDGRECKISLRDKELPEKVNLHLLDPSLSAAMENFFLLKWKESPVIRF